MKKKQDRQVLKIVYTAIILPGRMAGKSTRYFSGNTMHVYIEAIDNQTRKVQNQRELVIFDSRTNKF